MKPAKARGQPVGGRIAAADRAIMARISAADSRTLDHVMPGLSRAANRSVLWIGIAAGLAVTRNKWARRAALRGLASVAMASTASNVIGKGLTRRGRPATPVPPSRRPASCIAHRALPRSRRVTRPPPPRSRPVPRWSYQSSARRSARSPRPSARRG